MGRTKDKEINTQEVLLKATIQMDQVIAKASTASNWGVLLDLIENILDDAELKLVINKEHEKYLTLKQWKKSSNIKTTIYDSLLKRLTVEFKNGGVYDYEGVPKKVYKKFEKAESVGKFLSKEIIPKYKAFKRK
jgi:hypothetical protein